jgi:PKD repeat protein
MIVFQRKGPLVGALTLILAAWNMPAWGTGGCASAFQNRYGSGAGTTYGAAGCQTCHTSSIPERNGYGADVGQCSASDFDAAEALDSDTADGQPSVGGNNIAEITAGTQPGWCVPGTPNCVNVETPPGSISGPLDPPETNEPPVANAGGPYQTELGSPTLFDGTGSFDGDGDALSYAWDFGDGNSGTGSQPQHTYAAVGIYTVSLVVSDPLVASAPDMTTATISETVVNEPPIAAVGGPYAGEVGTSVQFDGSGSFDSDGDLLAYEWDFGDGNSGTGVTPSHTYSAAGTYTVSLVVSDGQTASPASSTTATISDAVVNEPPVAVIGGPYTGEAGTALQFDGSASFDPDGSVQSYSWDFGDGDGGTGANPVHTYATAGSYTVSLVVSDGSLDSAAATTTADVAEPAGNAPPTAVVGGPYAGTTGTPVQFDGSGSSDPNGDPLTYRWDFGDGAVGDGEMPSHGFAAAGNYTVTLHVNDGQFDSTPDSTTVAISDPAAGGDGEALYDVNCLGCHGSPWEEPAFDMQDLPGVRRVAGARECTIEGSIFGTSVYPGGVPSMQYLQDVLNDEEIGAIAEYLNSRAATGEQRYVAACAGCHGPIGSGGPAGESIQGEDAGDIAEAIREEDEMRFLECLPESDIVGIGEFLMTFDDDDDDGGGGGAPGPWLLVTLALARLLRQRRNN